jgi:hypothetical protein
MTKRTPATDITLSPSLAEILLELVNSFIILLVLTSARSAQETQWEKPAPKPLYTGTANAVHDLLNPYALGFAG